MDIWWKKIKRPLLIVGIIGACTLGVALIVGIIGGYLFNWDWTGFGGYNKVTTTHIISGTNAGTDTRTEEYQPGKGLWDWLQLLGLIAIPVVVGIGAAWFTAQQNHDREIAELQRKSDRELAAQRYEADRELATENQQESILQTYLDKMSELLLHENLSKSKREDVVANIAQTRTLIALSKLDPERKGYVIIFLTASGLINRRGKIIDLNYADLRGAKLRHISKLDGISLQGAYLEKADCSESELSNVNFQGAHLKKAILFKTDLRGADFKNADLSDAILIGANVSIEQLEEAESLKGATMPDGSIHP